MLFTTYTFIRTYTIIRQVRVVEGGSKIDKIRTFSRLSGNFLRVKNRIYPSVNQIQLFLLFFLVMLCCHYWMYNLMVNITHRIIKYVSKTGYWKVENSKKDCTNLNNFREYIFPVIDFRISWKVEIGIPMFQRSHNMLKNTTQLTYRFCFYWSRGIKRKLFFSTSISF